MPLLLAQQCCNNTAEACGHRMLCGRTGRAPHAWGGTANVWGWSNTAWVWVGAAATAGCRGRESAGDNMGARGGGGRKSRLHAGGGGGAGRDRLAWGVPPGSMAAGAELISRIQSIKEGTYPLVTTATGGKKTHPRATSTASRACSAGSR